MTLTIDRAKQLGKLDGYGIFCVSDLGMVKVFADDTALPTLTLVALPGQCEKAGLEEVSYSEVHNRAW